MIGKNVLITGGNSGIGLEAAVAIASKGAHVWIVSRDERRGDEAIEAIRARSGSQLVSLLIADFASQDSIRNLADRVKTELGRLDVLVNNAGLTVGDRIVTVDGLETTFAVNHLGYFLLTGLLAETMLHSAPARIVSVASHAHFRGSMHWDDLQGERNFSGWTAYCQSKLANVLFTVELARRLEGTGVTANCLHPGVVSTNFGSKGPGIVRFFFKLLRPFLTSPADGARTTIHLATSPDVDNVSGQYFDKCHVAKASTEAMDPASARRLWELSEQLTGFKWPETL